MFCNDVHKVAPSIVSSLSFSPPHFSSFEEKEKYRQNRLTLACACLIPFQRSSCIHVCCCVCVSDVSDIGNMARLYDSAFHFCFGDLGILIFSLYCKFQQKGAIIYTASSPIDIVIYHTPKAKTALAQFVTMPFTFYVLV